MASDGEEPKSLEGLLETPDLARALESDRFKQFLDQLPVAIAVAELKPREQIVYANHAFEQLIGLAADKTVGRFWDLLQDADGEPVDLASAIAENRENLGILTLGVGEHAKQVDAWANVIQDEGGSPVFRLVALVEKAGGENARSEDLRTRLEEKDTLLKELQHRVRNNLQMITALIRAEAKGVLDGAAGERFDRLAGRIDALALLYRSLSTDGPEESVDLGVYLSEIATSVMHAHAHEGIHLNLQVDAFPVGIDVAMPAGLVVNELLTNALKHAFEGRDGGAITLNSLTDALGCRVVVADDGIGLPEGATWPKPGKLSALIVRSLLQNAKARMDVESSPGRGLRVTIFFACEDAAPGA